MHTRLYFVQSNVVHRADMIECLACDSWAHHHVGSLYVVTGISRGSVFGISNVFFTYSYKSGLACHRHVLMLSDAAISHTCLLHIFAECLVFWHCQLKRWLYAVIMLIT